MKKHLFAALAAVLALTACKEEVKAAAPAPGVYRGTTPCADCEGINTTLTLAADGTYNLKMVYLGRQTAPFIEGGAYAWDAKTGILTLGAASKYKEEGGNLAMLDSEGKEITGALSMHYVLARVQNAPLAGTEWRLVELSGKPVEAGERPPFLIFSGKDAHVSGFTACNRLSGGYTEMGGKGMAFAQMASTKMACAENARMELEQRFLDALGRVSGYAIEGETLSLSGPDGVAMTFAAGVGGKSELK